MEGANGTAIAFNGEIYNHIELREQLSPGWSFRSHSDTECILAGYARWGRDVVDHLRGMFSFALWDEVSQRMFCARDRFGIKPFYYTVVDGVFYFASEAQALLPFLHEIDTDTGALAAFLTFHYNICEPTQLQGITQLLPAPAPQVR